MKTCLRPLILGFILLIVLMPVVGKLALVQLCSPRILYLYNR